MVKKHLQRNATPAATAIWPIFQFCLALPAPIFMIPTGERGRWDTL